MNKPAEIIIVGGGTSIKQADLSTLQPILASKFVILTNYSFRHFNGTFLCFQDVDFYKSKDITVNPDIYEELKQLPLIVGLNHNGIEEFKLDNTILIDKKYREPLTGILALKLAEILMENGTIYLLGFDFTRQGIPKDKSKYDPNSELSIHYYSKDEINHRGVGFTGYYDRHNPDKVFEKFIKKDVKIFNVSPESNITVFEKINYEHMFTLLNKEIYNQDELRTYVKEKLLCIK